jgi:3',5'-cyclic AMP phosphodiesterase CpdA
MRFAHLSDMHLLERAERIRGRRSLDVRFVSLGRRLDAEDRLAKARAAIAHARAAGAEHFLFTGDLTETGALGQFEVLAELLAECKLRSDEVTLLPGNHDAYASENAWSEALDGPLRPWAKNAASEPGKIVELADAFVLPVDATFHQPVTRSAARLTEELESAIAARLGDPLVVRSRVVVAIHHPPHPRPGPWHWVDGLLGGKRLLALVENAPNVIVAHGHLHQSIDRVHGAARVLGAAATVDGAMPEVFGDARSDQARTRVA